MENCAPQLLLSSDYLVLRPLGEADRWGPSLRRDRGRNRVDHRHLPVW